MKTKKETKSAENHENVNQNHRKRPRNGPRDVHHRILLEKCFRSVVSDRNFMDSKPILKIGVGDRDGLGIVPGLSRDRPGPSRDLPGTVRNLSKSGTSIELPSVH